MENQNCIFCKILKKEIPSVKLYEDDLCMVILDKFPATKGQSLIIAKTHEPYILNLDDKTYNHLFQTAKKISRAIDKSLGTLRTCFVVEGFEVPHVHIRLHPAYEKALKTKGVEAADKDLAATAKKIKKKIN